MGAVVTVSEDLKKCDACSSNVVHLFKQGKYMVCINCIFMMDFPIVFEGKE